MQPSRVLLLLCFALYHIHMYISPASHYTHSHLRFGNEFALILLHTSPCLRTWNLPNQRNSICKNKERVSFFKENLPMHKQKAKSEQMREGRKEKKKRRKKFKKLKGNDKQEKAVSHSKLLSLGRRKHTMAGRTTLSCPSYHLVVFDLKNHDP